jgi:hypothetical protein
MPKVSSFVLYLDQFCRNDSNAFAGNPLRLQCRMNFHPLADNPLLEPRMNLVNLFHLFLGFLDNGHLGQASIADLNTSRMMRDDAPGQKLLARQLKSTNPGQSSSGKTRWEIKTWRSEKS